MPGITIVYDAIHAQISSLPRGFAAGYVTGTSDIQWTAEDFASHPGAIRIDQSPVSTVWDATADVDDFERGAVSLPELAPRAKLRMAAFSAATRPGQREPLVYMSASNVTEVVNALIAGGISSGVGLFVANWNLTEPQSIEQVVTASGPFPVRGVQFHNAGSFDISVFDSSWIANVSGRSTGTITSLPPGEWEKAGIIGIGLDGKLWCTVLNPASGVWSEPSRLLWNRYLDRGVGSCLPLPHLVRYAYSTNQGGRKWKSSPRPAAGTPIISSKKKRSRWATDFTSGSLRHITTIRSPDNTGQARF